MISISSKAVVPTLIAIIGDAAAIARAVDREVAIALQEDSAVCPVAVVFHLKSW